ncbi:hypothetical protein K3495_g6050 [Podosphaera aphanis]|nr:hypothetical protein K3495_g6050 [Podosphaera aphanis]
MNGGTSTARRYSSRLNRDQRMRVLELNEARKTNREISDLLGITLSQVKYTIRSGCVSPKRSTGRPPVLTPEQDEELEAFVHSSEAAKQMSYLELSMHFDTWNVGQDAIRNALMRRGYSRFIPRCKPLLTDKHKKV